MSDRNNAISRLKYFAFGGCTLFFMLKLLGIHGGAPLAIVIPIYLLCVFIYYAYVVNYIYTDIESANIIDFYKFARMSDDVSFEYALVLRPFGTDGLLFFGISRNIIARFIFPFRKSISIEEVICRHLYDKKN